MWVGWIGQKSLNMAVAVGVRVRLWADALLYNEDGDLGAGQQIAITAVGIAIIITALMPALRTGMRNAVNTMMSKLTGI